MSIKHSLLFVFLWGFFGFFYSIDGIINVWQWCVCKCPFFIRTIFMLEADEK